MKALERSIKERDEAEKVRHAGEQEIQKLSAKVKALERSRKLIIEERDEAIKQAMAERDELMQLKAVLKATPAPTPQATPRPGQARQAQSPAATSPPVQKPKSAAKRRPSLS